MAFLLKRRDGLNQLRHRVPPSTDDSYIIRYWRYRNKCKYICQGWPVKTSFGGNLVRKQRDFKKPAAMTDTRKTPARRAR